MPDLPSNQSTTFTAGDGITLTFTETEGAYWDITIETSAGAGGHTIQDDDSGLAARTNLSFQDGFVVTDDAGGDQTEIDVSYGAAGYPLDVADTESDGTAITVARSDHVHSGAAYLKEADFDDVDFLVGTATGFTAAEIIVGTSPGGELGGTWGTPTVDATHAGSTHSAATDTHIADSSDAHDASAISIADAGNDFTATDVEGALDEIQADNEAHVAAADPHTGYVLESLIDAAGDYYRGSAADTVARQAASAATPAAVGTASAGTATNPPSADNHVHGPLVLTRRLPILGWATRPLSSAVFPEPFTVKATNDVWSRYVWVFNGSLSTRDGLAGGFAVPHDYVAGATLVIVWASTVITNEVVWDIEYRAVGGNDAESLDQAGTQESLTVTDTASSAANERMEVSIDLTDSNFAADDEVTFNFYRDQTDAADDLAGAVMLFNLFFEYTT